MHLFCAKLCVAAQQKTWYAPVGLLGLLETHSSLGLRGFVRGGFANSPSRPINKNTSLRPFNGLEHRNCSTTQNRSSSHTARCSWG